MAAERLTWPAMIYTNDATPYSINANLELIKQKCSGIAMYRSKDSFIGNSVFNPLRSD